MLKTQTASKLWKTWTLMWMLDTTWETIIGNIKISAKELKKYKPWFNE
jgi:hypothetical protein